MPFTPFHLGPGGVLKAVGGRHFSFMVFGGAQVLMDIEVLVRMDLGTPVLHGYWVELDRQRAITRAIAAARPNDAVLIAGKGHETYQIVGSTKQAFDDRHEARVALDARGETHA